MKKNILSMGVKFKSDCAIDRVTLSLPKASEFLYVKAKYNPHYWWITYMAPTEDFEDTHRGNKYWCEFEFIIIQGTGGSFELDNCTYIGTVEFSDVDCHIFYRKLQKS